MLLQMKGVSGKLAHLSIITNTVCVETGYSVYNLNIMIYPDIKSNLG